MEKTPPPAVSVIQPARMPPRKRATERELESLLDGAAAGKAVSHDVVRSVVAEIRECRAEREELRRFLQPAAGETLLEKAQRDAERIFELLRGK